MLHSSILGRRRGIGHPISCHPMDEGFDTRQLPGAPDVIAPDGSEVRVLLQLGPGSMAHFELGAGQISRPVAHHSVDEIWYVLQGRGQMWRRQAQRQETVLLYAGTCVSIPAGTHFQFRADRSARWPRSASRCRPGPARTKHTRSPAPGPSAPSHHRAGWNATVTRSDPDWLLGEARPALRA